jgi:hypothetical protein
VAPQWFGPKESGRGLRPLGGPGWTVTGVFVVILVVAALLGPKGIVFAAVDTGLYLGVIALTRVRGG